jgi:DNA-binding response OmpR family regulator
MIAPATAFAKILICDNQQDTRAQLRQVLSDAGYHPVITKTLPEVFPLIDSEQPKLLLLGITDSNEQVLHMASYLRHRGIDIPFFFLTSKHDTLSCAYSIAVGAAGYFKKPINKVDLLCRIEEILF